MVSPPRCLLPFAFAALVACDGDTPPILGPGNPSPGTYQLAEQAVRLIVTGRAYLNFVHAIGADGCGVPNAGNSITGVPTSQGVSVGNLTVVDVAIDGCPTAAAGGVEAEIFGVAPGTWTVGWTGGGSTIQQDIHVAGGTPNFDHLDDMTFSAQFGIRVGSSNCPEVVVDQDPDAIEEVGVERDADGNLVFVFADGRIVMTQRQSFVSAASEAPVEVSPGRYAEETWTGMVDWSEMHDPRDDVHAIISGTWRAVFRDGMNAPEDCHAGGPLVINTTRVDIMQ